MSRKILFCDLDGTLLCTDKSVTEENRLALQELLRAGHGVAITTGRSILGSRFVLEELGLDGSGCYLLAFQGNMIYDCGSRKVLWEDGIPAEKGIALMKALWEAGIYAHTYSRNEILTMETSENFWRYNRITKEPYRILKDLSELSGRILPKVIAIDFTNHERLSSFQKDYREKEGDQLVSFFSTPEYLEYCRYGSDKGNALRRLAEIAKVSISDTVSVGDERNDISMIQAAGIGVAMANARPEVKEAADYVTVADNNHSGVAEVILKFILKNG